MEAQNVRAPRFPTESEWLGVEQPLRLEEEFRGQVLLLDFWTYCCVNCLHMLPVLSAIERHFEAEAVQVVGVHAAKFDAEKQTENIEAAMQRHGVDHPTILDHDHKLWDAYGGKGLADTRFGRCRGLRARDSSR